MEHGFHLMEVIQAYTDVVKSNIEYDILTHDCKIGGKEYIDEIVDLMVETISNYYRAEVNHDMHCN